MSATVGPETPIVFLHPFPLDASVWKETMEAVGARTTLSPNFPGFGGRAPGPESIDGFAEAVAADMDEAGVDRAVIVGLSMGGYVALRMHALWPERVAALVLADTRAGADAPDGAAKRTKQAERARTEGVAGWLADTMIPNVLGASTRGTNPALVARVHSLMTAADPEGVARALLAMRDRPDSRSVLTEIAVPVLALVGSEDTVTPPDEARLIADAVPNGQLEVIEGAGHLSNLENPGSFDAALRQFLLRR
jgi:pimeloyl-ACP methyl ester carboxylesterase